MGSEGRFSTGDEILSTSLAGGKSRGNSTSLPRPSGGMVPLAAGNLRRRDEVDFVVKGNMGYDDSEATDPAVQGREGFGPPPAKISAFFTLEPLVKPGAMIFFGKDMQVIGS